MSEENIKSDEQYESASTGLLCGRTIKACAKLLDDEADRQEAIWNNYIKGDGKGSASSYHDIPRGYAKKIRNLAI